MSLYTSPREDFISALFGKPFEALTCKEICEKLGAINETSHVEFKELYLKKKRGWIRSCLEQSLASSTQLRDTDS
jgi:hypothetical protein